MPRNEYYPDLPNQDRVLLYFWEYQRARGYSPTVREVISALKLSSGSVTYHLNKLGQLDYLDNVPEAARTRKVTDRGKNYLLTLARDYRLPVEF